MANKVNPIINGKCRVKLKDNWAAEILPNTGKSTCTSNNASRNENTDKSNASPRNWRTNCFFSAPKTLRMPTSAARLAERAVARFIKLIQAISKIKIATEARMYKYDKLPVGITLDS